MKINFKQIEVQALPSFSTSGINTSVLRLDLAHAVVSGNKWFKLRYYLAEAMAQKKHTIASFGGAYSNHIVALAYACKEMDIKSVGFIRGEAMDSISLRDAKNTGMELHYISRGNYKDKLTLKNKYHQPEWYWIEEGGYGLNGKKGAASIYNSAELSLFTHIICAVGTGTMMAGLLEAADPKQQIIGISVLKNNFSVEKEIQSILEKKTTPLNLINDYHFGGYAKQKPALLHFMNDLYMNEGLPTDFVYTGKLFYAVNELIQQKYFSNNANILVIHSGGLQGNRSLPIGRLVF